MLRVAVNGFFESLGVVLHCMEELDIDVVGGEVIGGLEGVQGLEVKAS
jgi:EKC/KEOPS complex subunit PCC1/LAGE3